MKTEKRSERSALDPANLRDVLGDDEHSEIIGAGISGHQEEAYLLRIVGVRGSDKFFTIAKSDFRLPALILTRQCLRFLVFAIADEISGEKNGLQVLHWDIGAFALESILFQKKAETIFLSGEIVNVAFQTSAIEERDHGLVPVVRMVWRLRASAIPL